MSFGFDSWPTNNIIADFTIKRDGFTYTFKRRNSRAVDNDAQEH